MKTIQVRLKNNSYPILTGTNILGRLGAVLKGMNIGTDAVIVTNPVVRRLHAKALVAGLKKSGFTVKVMEVPDGERAKSAKYAFGLMEKIARYDTMKKVFVIAFGGGVVGDLAGYVAAAYKRGVPYVQVPTTLLAQIDSAIGGKVAIDLPVGKNLVGAFYQPKIVYSDMRVLSTLSRRQIRNGLAEAVKYGVIADSRLFRYIAGHYKKLLAAEPAALEYVVDRCSRIKARVVEADELETKSIRTILNFGHTVGHAVEAAGGYQGYHHGEAVALGMRVAADISSRLGLLSRSDAAALNGLLSAVGLPGQIKKVRLQNILKIMAHDKKFKAGKNRFVLARTIGKVCIREGVAQKLIRQAIRAHMA